MKMNKYKFVIILVSIILIILICSNSFATSTCHSEHDSLTVSGSCGCDAVEWSTCGGAIVKTYHYTCVGTCGGCAGCAPNGTQPGIVGYNFPCNEVSCGSDPNICTNNCASVGVVIPGDVMHCSCS